MKTPVIQFLLVSLLNNVYCVDVRPATTNSSEPKDMYVVHATVYQVGILTNKTDDEVQKGHEGNQETITFYHHNGSAIDLSGIPDPLVTNVTAQSIVGVAPVAQDGNQQRILPWSALENLASLQPEANMQVNSTPSLKVRIKRDVASVPVKIVKGTTVIPEENGVQSLALPPLLTFNNNLSNIPVPIPNTSIVRYAKINTLVKNP